MKELASVYSVRPTQFQIVTLFPCTCFYQIDLFIISNLVNGGGSSREYRISQTHPFLCVLSKHTRNYVIELQ